MFASGIFVNIDIKYRYVLAMNILFVYGECIGHWRAEEVDLHTRHENHIG